MADIVDKETRSRMMASIRGRNTKPEMRVRSALHSAGFRYRLHVANLPGKPDLVLPRFNAVIFVQGCYWHRHAGCPAATTPASNVEFWQKKFQENVARDARHIAALRAGSWRVGVVWECATRRMNETQIASAVGGWLKGSEEAFEFPGPVAGEP